MISFRQQQGEFAYDVTGSTRDLCLDVAVYLTDCEHGSSELVSKPPGSGAVIEYGEVDDYFTPDKPGSYRIEYYDVAHGAVAQHVVVRASYTSSLVEIVDSTQHVPAYEEIASESDYQTDFGLGTDPIPNTIGWAEAQYRLARDVNAVRTSASGAGTVAAAALPKAGGTMTGDIATGGHKITGLPTPAASDEAATKSYVDGRTAARPDTSPNCTVCWTCDEAAPPYANSGTGGALNLAVYSNADVKTRDGVYGGSAQMRSVSTDTKGILQTATTSIGESNSITISLWVNVKPKNNYAVIIGKNYYANDASSAPYFGVDMRFLDSTAVGKWSVGVCVGGSLREISLGTDADALDSIPLLAWTHLCITYDAATGVFSAYRNGVLLGTRTDAAGNIDWGTHGRWVVGADNQSYPRSVVGYVDDIRIKSVAWTAAEVLAHFRASRGYS
jgi:hypothetical protein